jgi:hypothetical protein
MIDTLLRTLLLCGTAVVALWAGQYIADIERRITTLEDRANLEVEVTLPDFFSPGFIDRNKRGDDSK